MNIDTATLRRLRDVLVGKGQKALSPLAALFSAQAGEVRASVRRVSPFVETMYLMMVVDGVPDSNEQEVIRDALEVLTRGVLQETELKQILRRCEVLVREQGVEARLQAVGSRLSVDRLDREMAFSLAATVALADRRLAGEESTLLASVGEWYGISALRRAQLLQQLKDDA